MSYELNFQIISTASNTSDTNFPTAYDSFKMNLSSQIVLLNTLTNLEIKPDFHVFLEDNLAGIVFQERNVSSGPYHIPIYSSFYPINCSCGSAGCVGFHNGVTISFNDKFITWKSPQQDGYKDVLPSVCNFDKQKYISTIKLLREQLINLELDKPDTYRINSMSIPKFFERISLIQAYYWKNQFSNKRFQFHFLVDEELNHYHNPRFKSLSYACREKEMKKICYKTITHNAFLDTK